MALPDPKAPLGSKASAMDHAKVRAREERRTIHVLRYLTPDDRGERGYTASVSSDLQSSPTEPHGYYDPEGRWHPIRLDDLDDLRAHLYYTVQPAAITNCTHAHDRAPEIPAPDALQRELDATPNKLAAWMRREDVERLRAARDLGFQEGYLSFCRALLNDLANGCVG